MAAKTPLQTLLIKRNPEKAKLAARFFKTKPDEYGAGDKFLGINVPTIRILAQQFRELPLPEIKILLKNKWHEAQQLGLYILVYQFTKGDAKKKKIIYHFYIKHRAAVNNWDLVDTSTPQIIGEYIFNHFQERKILYRFAKSKNVWERRMAVLATFAFIRKNDFTDTLKIAKLLLADRHDLIHKAVGWMLREVGNRNVDVLKKLLNQYLTKLPRTTLRYAIEKFPEKERQKYLNQKTTPVR